MVEIKNLAEIIKNPSKDCYPVVMWFWNDTITEREIKRQLGEFKEKKIYEFFIHPLWGLTLRYLSKRFFELIGVAIDYAKENGMTFWIYDEYNWPSGTAGGTLIKKHPWTKASYLSYAKFELKAGEKLERELAWPVIDGFFTQNGKTAKAKFFKKSKNSFSWQNTTGEDGVLTVVYRQRHQGMTTTAYGAKYSNEEPGYLDLMSGKAVDLFLKSTHEKYKEYFGSEFGKTLRGIFTDEPSFSIFVDTKDGAVAYTDEFFKEFKALKGYDARKNMWKMFESPENKAYSAFKKDWYETLSHLFEKNFSIKYKKWCDDNGVLLTGHLICEEVLAIQTYQNGYFYDILKHFDRPGMDTILSKETVDGEGFNIAGYLAGAIGKFANKDRILCETYSGSGWNCSHTDMKRIANRLMIQGVNFLMYMGAYYSMRGMRKILPGGYPPTHNGLSPQFEYYTELNDYLAAIQEISSKTVSDAKTLVLHPITSCMANAEPHYIYNGNMVRKDYYSEGTHVKEDATLCGIVNALQEMNRSFNLGYETALDGARVENGKLVVAGSAYEMIILPCVTAVKANTAKLLSQFAAEGGVVVLANSDAVYDIENKNKRIFKAPKEAVEALCEQNAGNAESERLSRVFATKGLVTLITNDVCAKQRKSLMSALDTVYERFDITELYTVKGEKVFSGMRKDGDLYYILLVNDLYNKNSVKFVLNEAECAAVIDLQSRKLCAAVNRDEAVRLCFGGADGKLVIAGNRAEIETIASQFEEDKKLCLCEKTAYPLEITAKFPYNLKRFFYRVSKVEKTDELLKLSYNELEKALCENKEEFLKPMGELGYGTGFSAADQRLYPLLDFGRPFVAFAEFEVNEIPKRVKLGIEKLFDTKVILNGKEVTDFKQSRVFNPDDLTKDVSDMLKVGKNTLILIGSCVDWGYFHTLPFTALMGDFSLCDGKIAAPAQLKACDITENGYPNFAGIYEYNATVKGDASAVLSLESFDAVTVFVNGEKVRDLVHAPRVCDISRYLKKGNNKIKLVMRTKLNNIFAEPEKTGITKAEIYR
ncbi:MAG: hypothetical protein IKA51_03965 [Clostridia bacterium]|nr:hypothetical protein [Clostridia bacterium]